MKPDYWLHGIRGKVGKNIAQAFVWNKGSHHRLINPLTGDVIVYGLYEGGGGGLIRISVNSH